MNGFIEPLESNGLFTVHEFLFYLAKTLQRGKVSQWDRDVYNEAARTTYDQFAEFIRLHYALSLRDDSEYWKNNLDRSFDFSKYSEKEFNHLPFVQFSKMHSSQIPSFGGVPWITTGMNYLLIDPVSAEQKNVKDGRIPEETINQMFAILVDKKKNWNNIALQSETSYQYLKRKYHDGK